MTDNTSKTFQFAAVPEVRSRSSTDEDAGPVHNGVTTTRSKTCSLLRNSEQPQMKAAGVGQLLHPHHCFPSESSKRVRLDFPGELPYGVPLYWESQAATKSPLMPCARFSSCPKTAAEQVRCTAARYGASHPSLVQHSRQAFGQSLHEHVNSVPL